MKLTLTEQRIFAASKGTPVALANELEFFTTINKAAVMFGVNPPSNESILLMHGVLTDQLMWVTLEDIELAVRMAVAGNFGHQPTYGELSTSFLCHILGLYDTLRGPAKIKYREIEERENNAKQLPSKSLNDRDYIEILERDIQSCAKGKAQWVLAGTMMVPWLYQTERIRDEDFTDSQWRDMKRKARANVMDRKQIGENAVRRMSEETAKKFEQECLLELRRVVYENYVLGRARR